MITEIAITKEELLAAKMSLENARNRLDYPIRLFAKLDDFLELPEKLEEADCAIEHSLQEVKSLLAMIEEADE